MDSLSHRLEGRGPFSKDPPTRMVVKEPRRPNRARKTLAKGLSERSEGRGQEQTRL